jgi:murein DD-endopeptidase MepM/ murein hydrolase activator NlpD
MDGLDDVSPQRPGVSSTHRNWHASRRVRVVVGGLALADLAILVIVALLAGQILISPAASPTPSPTPTTTPSLTSSPTPAASPTATPTPAPTPVPGPPTAAPPSKLTGYVWPLVNAKITLPFGPSPWGEFLVNGKLFHDGVDMATQCGDKVMAAHDGFVLAAGIHYDTVMGWMGDTSPYGRYLTRHNYWSTVPIVVVIDDGDGYRSIYAHESRVTVKVNQYVTAGQTIGYEGATGNASGCHLHFGLFSPLQTATFDNLPDYITRLQLPATITARIDPLLVLPYRNDLSEMRKLRPADADAWASAHPSAHSSAGPSG